MTYSEKLRDPRWQKMRLLIMSRDSFACTICKDTKSTLNVHHIHYELNVNPWEYEPESLRTLCSTCHHTEHKTNAKANTIKELVYMVKRYLTSDEIDKLCNQLDPCIKRNFKNNIVSFIRNKGTVLT